ncbi:MAG TPA: cytochrome P450, partial [Planctomycetes bacterium]|nr:cytochrome P450 [Planctomycetota bacterium]
MVGVLPKIWRDPLRFFSEVAHEHGPVARVGLGKFTLYLLSQPEPIQHVLQDNAQNYWKG